MTEQRLQSVEESLRELLRYEKDREKDRVGMQKDIDRLIELHEEEAERRKAFEKTTNDRLRAIEETMPNVQLVTKGVIWAAMGILAAAVTLVWKAAVKVLSTMGIA